MIMLDDYFLTGRPARIEQILYRATDVLLAAASEADLPVDLIVRESAMTEHAKRVLSLLDPEHVVGGVLRARTPYRSFGIGEIPLWRVVNGTRQWTCPFLVAVWQLTRLGVVPLDASHIECVGRHVPLATDATLTLLSSHYLATEAAAQAVCASLVDPELRDYVAERTSHVFVPALR